MKLRKVVVGLAVCVVALTACGKQEVDLLEEETSVVQQVEEETSIPESESIEETSVVESTQECEEETGDLKTYYGVVFTGTDKAKIEAIKAIRTVTEYGLEEAKAIVDQPSAVISLYSSEEEAKNVADILADAEVNTQIFEVNGNFATDNIFRIDNAFKLSGRGTVVTGINYSNVMKAEQTVYHVKKDGTAVQTKIACIEEFKSILDETRPGDNFGVEVPDLNKEDIEAGDILVAAYEENDIETVCEEDFYGAFCGEPIIAMDGTINFENVLNSFIQDGWSANHDNFEEANIIDLVNESKSSGITFMNLPTMKSYVAGVSREADGNKPNITWNGLTWGASIDEIKEKYGTPVSESEDMYEYSYVFQVEDGKTIQFDIAKDSTSEPGLCSVLVTLNASEEE